jgi:hypothetical protein
MGHLKTANAMVTHPRVTGRGWDGVRRVAASGASTQNLSDQAREILGGSLDPDQWLFTHCTIVASVDVDKVAGAEPGKIKVGSATVDRRYTDYHIKPESSQYVNNNGDSWSRQVLLASYPTFVGGHNFQEHVQVEEKSKGRIIDAVARDIGDSVYVDILVATSLKHTGLIADIRSKKMGTLSMGCTTDFTICTKCGHYAVDETDLCDHVKTAKLNTFIDDNSQTRVIAELCGHVDHDETGGVHFIEASWVAVPAFTGAVMRNILSTGDVAAQESEIRRILSTPRPSWSDSAIAKAASMGVVGQSRSRVAFEFGGDDEKEEGGEAPAAETAAPPFKDLEDEVYDRVKDRVRKRLEQEMREKEVAKAIAPSDGPNDTLNKEARVSVRPAPTLSSQAHRSQMNREAGARYNSTLKNLVRVASSDAALVEGCAATNKTFGVRVDPRVYRAVLAHGGIKGSSSEQSYVRKCARVLGRDLSLAELRVVVRVGTLLSLWEGYNNPTPPL